MQEILGYLQSVEGVIGVAAILDSGSSLAARFPAFIDQATIDKAARLVVETTAALQVTDSFDSIDLRYGEGRIYIKKFSGCYIFALCAKTINLHLLATNLNLASAKIEKVIADSQAQGGGVISEAKPAVASEVGHDPSILTLPISELANREASASFDSLGMVALSHSTAQYVSDFYKSQFKKINLTSASGKSGSFPVMVMKDMEPIYDGAIIIGPGIEKKLGVTAGEKVMVKLA